MELMMIVTLLAVIELGVFGSRVGLARARFGVEAPATTGNEMFERYYRVHYNTIEHMILFLPGLWAFGYYIGQVWAAALGVVFLVGRIWYAASYIRDPAKRGPGMLMSFVPCWILLVGGLIGAILQMFQL